MVPTPPVARILMWRAVMPISLQRVATSWAASMAAYGDDSSRSALTFMPPVTRAIVSRPERSVTWTNVSLNEANCGRRGESVSERFLERRLLRGGPAQESATALVRSAGLDSVLCECLCAAQDPVDPERERGRVGRTMRATPKTSSPSLTLGPSEVTCWRSAVEYVVACRREQRVEGE